MAPFDEQEFDRGWKDGVAAFTAALPQVCPVMPEAIKEQSGLPEYVDGWLMGWAEADMSDKEDRANEAGFDAGAERNDWIGKPCPHIKPRLKEAWHRGYAAGSVALFSGSIYGFH